MPIGSSDGSFYEDEFSYHAAQLQPQDDYHPSDFDTQLGPQEEKDFQTWKEEHAPKDSGYDYDLRGAFMNGDKASEIDGHWPDTWKKPNHPTFSDQSVYAPYGNPGTWDSDKYIPYDSEKPVTGPADAKKPDISKMSFDQMKALFDTSEDPRQISATTKDGTKKYSIQAGPDPEDKVDFNYSDYIAGRTNVQEKLMDKKIPADLKEPELTPSQSDSYNGSYGRKRSI